MSEQPMLPGMPADKPPLQETGSVPAAQRTGLGTTSLIWLVGGGLVVLFAVIIVVATAHARSTRTMCQGGPDRLAGDQVTYQSDDGTHWTAEYPCINGGSTTLPVAKTGTW